MGSRRRRVRARQKVPDLLHYGLEVVSVKQNRRVSHPVSLEITFIDHLPRAKGATGHIPSQMEQLHSFPGGGRISVHVLIYVLSEGAFEVHLGRQGTGWGLNSVQCGNHFRLGRR